MKEIVVKVNNGAVVEVYGIPIDVIVKIVDYDTEGMLSVDLQEHDGKECAVSYWSIRTGTRRVKS